MFPAQTGNIDPDELSRGEDQKSVADHARNAGLSRRTDMVIKENIHRALSKNNFLQAVENDEIDIHVKNGIVCLSGHIVNTSSQSRIDDALRDIPGILGMKNKLVLDDKLVLEVAASLVGLEHAHGCKFFTGALYGVVSLNGVVSKENVKMLAEKCAAINPNVRGVINNIQVLGAGMELPSQPFLQPMIGEIIYFIGGVSGIVRKVIINPNNRRVIAMTIQGKFTDQEQELKSLNNGELPPSERVIVLPMSAVRYLTKASGFLNIHSNERKRYLEFEPANFFTQKKDWKAPYPYCPNDVLIPIEYQNEDAQPAPETQLFPFGALLEDTAATKENFANNAFGL